MSITCGYTNECIAFFLIFTSGGDFKKVIIHYLLFLTNERSLHNVGIILFHKLCLNRRFHICLSINETSRLTYLYLIFHEIRRSTKIGPNKS